MTKKDLLNSLKEYIEVLKFDKKSAEGETKEVLTNVICSLKEIVLLNKQENRYESQKHT